MTQHLTTDADLLSAADAGELWRVEDGEAFSWSRVDLDHLGTPGHLELDDNYGTIWVFVRADTAAEAVKIASAYDNEGNWRVEEPVALTWA